MTIEAMQVFTGGGGCRIPGLEENIAVCIFIGLCTNCNVFVVAGVCSWWFREYSSRSDGQKTSMTGETHQSSLRLFHSIHLRRCLTIFGLLSFT
jgi:hypothetical protein